LIYRSDAGIYRSDAGDSSFHSGAPLCSDRSELADYLPRYWPSLRVTVKARHFGFQLASQRTFHKRLYSDCLAEILALLGECCGRLIE